MSAIDSANLTPPVFQHHRVAPDTLCVQAVGPAGFLAFRVVGDIRTGYVTKSAANQNVRREVFLRWIARQAHPGRESVSAPPDPAIVRITVR